MNITEKWLLCPSCGSKTRVKLRQDTELRNFLKGIQTDQMGKGKSGTAKRIETTLGIATTMDDDALREKTAKLWSEMNHAPITPETINCEGCR